MPRLTPWESETRLIGLYIGTGLLKDEDAQSVLLVGPPGQGKTKMIMRFNGLPTVKMFSDLTSDGIRRAVSDNPRIKHFLMPEFGRLFSRDRSVSSQTANLLCNLMTGDAGTEHIGHKTYDFSGRQIGVIGAMTTDVFRERESDLAMTGLLSRFTVIRVDRGDEERRRVIANMVSANLEDLSPVRWPQLKEPRSVSYSKHLGSEITAWLDAYERMPSDERFVARLLVLLKSCALLNGHDRATSFDLDVLMRFTPYFAGDRDVRLEWPGAGEDEPARPYVPTITGRRVGKVIT